MDISNLTYKELETLEKEIEERKKEIEKNRYRFFVGGVLNAIDSIIGAGYGDVTACYDDNAVSYTWKSMLFEIQQEYKRKTED